MFLVEEKLVYDDKINGVADPCTEASLFWGDQETIFEC